MRTVFADGNQYDDLIDEPELLATITSAVHRGDLKIIADDVVRGELARTSNDERRRRLLEVHDELSTWVPSNGLVFVDDWDEEKKGPLPKLGRARIGSQQTSDAWLRLRGSVDSRHYQDAVIILTAWYEGADLATNEQKRMRNKAREQGLVVTTLHEIAAELAQSAIDSE